MPVPMPNFVQMLPGMETMATIMMKQKIAGKDVASIEDLRTACLESGVKFIACQMTVDLFDFKATDFIEGIEFGGAATFFQFAGEPDVNLFIYQKNSLYQHKGQTIFVARPILANIPQYPIRNQHTLKAHRFFLK